MRRDRRGREEGRWGKRRQEGRGGKERRGDLGGDEKRRSNKKRKEKKRGESREELEWWDGENRVKKKWRNEYEWLISTMITVNEKEKTNKIEW